jgi:hypothetical protein
LFASIRNVCDASTMGKNPSSSVWLLSEQRSVTARLKKEHDIAFDGEPRITDPAGKQLFDETTVAIGASDAAYRDAYQAAERGRLASPTEEHASAYRYLSLAYHSITRPLIAFDGPHPTEQLFHFAGHAFREIGQLNRAADAYKLAALIAVTSGDVNRVALGTRSLARAKMCYSEIGETANAEAMHVLEWDARRLARGRRSVALGLWYLTSHYGTNFVLWLRWLCALLVLFAVCYQALYSGGLIASSGHRWTFLVTAAYVATTISATVTFGDAIPTNWLSQAIVTIDVAVMYSFIAVGFTILGQKVLQR